jgi:hypothetical protein
MELLILNTNLVVVAVLDAFESMIWTERYNSYGDFEVYTKATSETLDILRPDYYVVNPESEYVMIIEERKIDYDVEEGYRLLINGRSVEALLDRRIVWVQTVLSGDFQDGIARLLNENVISPTDPDRTISTIEFEASIDSNITDLTVDAQFTRTNLYESIKKLCDANELGFKMVMNDDLDGFIFKVYYGSDRSYSQVINPYVIFSKGFENLLSSEYKEAYTNLKNVSVVAGEGEGDERTIKVVGSGIGLERREMYTDARDLQSTEDGTPIPELDYLSQLEQRGVEDLLENDLELSFDGKVDISQMFIYRQHFNIGDIVQIVSDYDIEAKAQIMEIIRSQGLNGSDIYPTFKIVS